VALSPGARLGPYEIVSPLGTGGMGEVYRTRDTRLDRTVALKVLPSDLATDAAARARFEREARAVAALDHPHICSIFDVGEADGTLSRHAAAGRADARGAAGERAAPGSRRSSFDSGLMIEHEECRRDIADPLARILDQAPLQQRTNRERSV
jgi:serine/threonine protein kinase